MYTLLSFTSGLDCVVHPSLLIQNLGGDDPPSLRSDWLLVSTKNKESAVHMETVSLRNLFSMRIH